MEDILKNYTLITDPQDVPDVANCLDRNPEFALDLETTGLRHKFDTIHGISLATHDQEWYICLGAENQMMEYLPSLSAKRMVAGHNLKFDMHFLLKHGVRLPNIFDTMVAQFLVDENQALGLKELAPVKLRLPTDLPDFDDLRRETKRLLGRKRLEDVTVSDMPLRKLARYAARDTRLTLDLMRLSRYELEKEGMLGIFNTIEMPFLQVLLDIEQTGFYVDQGVLSQLEVEFAEAAAAARQRFIGITGVENPNSTKQVGGYFYGTMGYKPTEFTATGAPAVNVLALTRLKHEDKTGAAEALLEYRQYEKLMGTYVTTIQENILNGWIYGNFNHTGTVTGRLSSSDPFNFQNFPSRGDTGRKIRSMFGAPPGYVFTANDYSQIELRLLAHYSKDPNFLRVFEEGGDPHQMTADFIKGMGFEIARSNAKQVNFGWAYGIGPRGLCDTIEKVSGERPKEADAKTWLNGFGQAYPSAVRWGRRVIDYARQLGYVKTIGGRKRRLPDITSPDKALRGYAERQAVNSIIQGSTADIMKWAMIGVHRMQGQYGARMNAQVHDEITAIAPENTGAEFAQQASEIMVSAREHFGIRVKIESAPGVGKNWSEAH